MAHCERTEASASAAGAGEAPEGGSGGSSVGRLGGPAGGRLGGSAAGRLGSGAAGPLREVAGPRVGGGATEGGGGAGGFAAICCLNNVAILVTEYESVCPPYVGGELALGTVVLEDRQFDLECLTVILPRLASMLLCPEGDPDAPDIPTLRSYAEATTGKYSSQWKTAMDAKMASWKATGTYADEVPPPRANMVDGMWIFRVGRPPGSPPDFKARYVARGFTQHDYELHSLNFSTAFLQGNLHEPRTASLRSPHASREWHDTLRTTLAALGFAPSTADPSLFLRTDPSLPPFYIFVYVDDLVFATADIEALTLVKAELQKIHTCTDRGELRSYLGLQITRDRARRTITQRFGFRFSLP
ncbi:unnamed protein product [Closterium sp. NIES-53]